MRKEWQLHALGDVCKMGSGGTPLTSKREYYNDGTIPWLQSGEVAQGEVRTANNFITQAGFENSAARIFPRDTVLVAMYGATAGQVGILRFEASTNQAICGIIPNERFHPKFLYYALLSKKKELISRAVGNAQPNISQVKIKNTYVPVPPVVEQKRIVAILDEAFEGIETAVANAEKNFASARELYDNYLNSAFRQSGQEAVNTTLGTVCELQNGFAFKSDLFKTEGIPVLRISSIQNGEVCDNRPVFTSLTDYREDLSRYVVSHGDLLIAMSGATTGKVGFNNTGKEFLLNQRVGNFRPGLKLNKRYLYYFLYTKSENHLAMSAGSAQPNLSTKQIKEIIIPLPTMVKQLHLVRNITAIDGRLALLKSSYERKIAALSILRQAILGEAFSGRLSSTAAKSLPEAAE